MLGLYRDKRLIPHDTDLDVNVLDSPVISLPGFKLIRTIFDSGLAMQTAFIKDGVIFDIYYFYTRDDIAFNRNDEGHIEKPLRFLDLSNITVNGHTYPVPSPVEEFLSWRFGPDWRIPKVKKDPWTADAHHLIRSS